MKERLNAYQVTPELVQQAIRLQEAIDAVGVDKTLAELIKIRVSQINGCAYCLHMHTRDARKLGESEARIYVLSAWRESTMFNAKERAVLAWTEALTHVAERGAPAAIYDELKTMFSDAEIVGLTTAIGMINFWNRVAIGLGSIHPAETDRAR
jgi:AhpD family alkylhydroperoxidase